MKSALIRLLRAYPFVMVRIRAGSLIKVLFSKKRIFCLRFFSLFFSVMPDSIRHLGCNKKKL